MATAKSVCSTGKQNAPGRWCSLARSLMDSQVSSRAVGQEKSPEREVCDTGTARPTLFEMMTGRRQGPNFVCPQGARYFSVLGARGRGTNFSKGDSEKTSGLTSGGVDHVFGNPASLPGILLRKSIQTGATRRYWAKGHRGWHLLRMQPWARPEIGRLAQGEEAGNFRRQPIRQHRRRRSAQNGRETHEKGCFTGRRPLDGIDTRKSFMATEDFQSRKYY